MNKIKRKKRFIDSKVQGSIAVRVVRHFIVFVLSGALLGFVMQVLSSPLEPMSEHIRRFWQYNGPYILVLLVMLPIFIYDMVKLSHRVAGPIYRLRVSFREITATGKPFEIRFRKDDFWPELAAEFNTMMKSITAETQRIEEDTDTDTAHEEPEEALV